MTRALVLSFFLMLQAANSFAAELRLTLANDPVAGNSRPDDLYTSSLGIELTLPRARLTAGERMFTDRVRGFRFDETFLSLGMTLPKTAGWEGEGALGILHVGQGLLGASVQNQVHGWIGSSQIELPYIEDRSFVTLEAALSRPLRSVAGAHLSTEAGVFIAPDFRSWLQAGFLAERPLGADLALRLGLGARTDWTESAWLGDHVADFAPTGEIGLAWRSLVLSWLYNEYGTRSSHLSLSVRR